MFGTGMSRKAMMMFAGIGLCLGLVIPLPKHKVKAQTTLVDPYVNLYAAYGSEPQHLLICCTGACWDNGTNSMTYTDANGTTYTWHNDESTGEGNLYCGQIAAGIPTGPWYSCFYGTLPDGTVVICVKPPVNNKYDGFCDALAFADGNYIHFKKTNPWCWSPPNGPVEDFFGFYIDYSTQINGS